MSKPLTVLGDKTDHGGTVMTATPFSLTGGKPIARVGDKVPCPRCGDPNAVIVGPGDPTTIIDGAEASVHGDKTSCGATIVASQMFTTAGGPGGASKAAAKPTAASMSADMAPADMALQSDAQSFDELPDEAKLHVFNEAANRGVFDPYEQGIYVDPDEYSETRDADDKPVLTTSDQKTYDRLVRQKLGANPYQPIGPDQIRNADPNDPDIEGLNPDGSSQLQKVSTIELTDGKSATYARFVDGRGSPEVGDMDGAEPEVASKFSNISNMRSRSAMASSAMDKYSDARDLGKRGSAVIYQDPRTNQHVVFMQQYRENVQGTGLVDVGMTKTQIAQQLNSDAVSNLDNERQRLEKNALDKFYRDNYTPGE